MASSVWKLTLEEFADKVGEGPVPAGVSIAAVAAALALKLIEMTLRVTARRRDFTGDRDRLRELLGAVRSEAAQMVGYADKDVSAYQNYLKNRKSADAAASLRVAIDVPMEIARAASRGLELCAAASELVSAGVAPDLGSAASILAAASRAATRSAEANAALSSDRKLIEDLASERRVLELSAGVLIERVFAAARIRQGQPSRDP